jgi:hypothetical protein
MAYTYEPIATTTLSVSAVNITFSSIPQTYTDLRVVIWGTHATGGDITVMRFNGDTATNYTNTYMRSTSTSTGAVGVNDYGTAPYIALTNRGSSATIPEIAIADIFAYTDTAKFKSVLTESGELRDSTSGQITAFTSIWKNTAAITSIVIKDDSYNLGAGFMATIYGIKAA